MREQIAQQTHSQEVDTDRDYDYEDVWPTRMPSSARRYDNVQTTFQRPIPQQNAQQSPRQVTPIQQRRSLTPAQRSFQPGTYIDGNTRLNIYQGAPPPAPTKRNKPRVRERDTEDRRSRG